MEVERLKRLQYDYWIASGQATFLEKKDKNTKFFKAQTLQHKQKNWINGLKNEKGAPDPIRTLKFEIDMSKVYDRIE